MRIPAPPTLRCWRCSTRRYDDDALRLGGTGSGVIMPHVAEGPPRYGRRLAAALYCERTIVVPVRVSRRTRQEGGRLRAAVLARTLASAVSSIERFGPTLGRRRGSRHFAREPTPQSMLAGRYP